MPDPRPDPRPDWRQTRVAPEATHHLLDDRPLYDARFDEVLTFHAPGLAPVRSGDRAWHIDLHGEPAYARRFTRTFGFYHHRAAVIGRDGWHHVLADGSDLHPGRYHWCGNFQDARCTVRADDGRYHHIDLDGRPAYDRRWRYAGDYRAGIAVVQAENGLSSHIDHHGALLHGSWFLDLDVFHKGFARARDDDGWTHVDHRGQAVYPRRFAMVEPFYNGQARAERFDGGLEVIDERGATICPLRPARPSEFHALSADLVGFWRSETIAAAVELGIFETLPGRTQAIARATGLSPAAALRLLRALGELQLVSQRDGEWSATRRGQHLRRDHPLTLCDAAIEYARHFAPAWARLPAILRGDDQPPEDVFARIAGDPRRVQRTQRMLRSYAREDYREIVDALDASDIVDLGGIEHLIDAGAGPGVIAELLVQAHPSLRVTLLDRPEVIAGVTVTGEHASRLIPRACDLFEPWNLRADAVLLARVLHDWSDDRAVVLLGHARDALDTGQKLLVVEMLRDEDGGGLCDLHLLVATGGAERTRGEFDRLLARAGFALREVRDLGAVPSLLIAEAV